MSLYAFEVEAKRLQVVADAAALRAACPVDEVRAERWLFFAEDGSPLRPQFRRAESGAEEDYYLRPWASCGSCSLPQILPFIEETEGVSRDVLMTRFASGAG